MPLPALALPLGALALSMFSGSRRPKPATNTQTGTNTGTSTSTPTTAPAFEGLQNMILPMITRRLSQPSALPEGFVEGNLANINRTHDMVKQGLDNDLTSRGLGTSPVAGHAMSVFNRGRASDIVGFQNKIPGIERDMANDDLDMAMRILGMGQGRTTTSTGSNTGTGSFQQPGGGWEGALGGFGDMLGFLIGSGMLGKNKTGAGSGRSMDMGPFFS